MRAFSIIVACLALAAGIGCVSVVSKFRAMYEDMGATLPILTETFLNTSGLVPGGIFIVMALLLIILVALGKPKVAGIVAAPTLLFSVAIAVVLPPSLMAPLSSVIREVETSYPNREE